MRFSSLIDRFPSETNALYLERDRLQQQGLQVIDLISGNVHQHGLFFPQEVLEGILTQAARDSRVYRPDSLGRPSAREAVHRYYQRYGLDIPSRQILLTPGSSVSYWYSFRILADPGDAFLAPVPSYPLFDQIASMAGVTLIPYRLDEARNWAIDPDRLRRAVTPRTRGILLISPHNPTGRISSTEELRVLADIAAEHRLAILSDEVFSEFLFDVAGEPGKGPPGEDRPGDLPRAAATHAPLVITLNGFSKMFALPGLKIGWMALTGEQALVDRAMGALESLSDTFLPVGEIQQAAVSEIFRQGEPFLSSYVQTVRSRCRSAVALLSRSPHLELVPPQGGFYLCMRLRDRTIDEEAFVVALLRKRRVLLHPGFFYDLETPHLVASIVSEHEEMAEGGRRLLQALAADERPATERLRG